MTVSAMIQPNKIRLPWRFRGKIELSPLQLVGENLLGLPYLQGQICNRSAHGISLRMVICVYNEQHQLVFAGTPGVLERLYLDPQQQRTFRTSLRTIETSTKHDYRRLWLTRSHIEIRIEA
jgi:hypothetical protein